MIYILVTKLELFLIFNFPDECLELSKLHVLLYNVFTGEADFCLTLEEAFGTMTYDNHMLF